MTGGSEKKNVLYLSGSYRGENLPDGFEREIRDRKGKGSAKRREPGLCHVVKRKGGRSVRGGEKFLSQRSPTQGVENGGLYGTKLWGRNSKKDLLREEKKKRGGIYISLSGKGATQSAP